MHLNRLLLVLGTIFFNLIPLQGAAQRVDETRSSLGRFSVRDSGARGDGITRDTQAITTAIQRVSKLGGGTVVFTPGVYLTGTFRLMSNVTLEVEAGAVILGSRSVEDYGTIKDYGFGRNYGVDYTGEGTRIGLIIASEADNIAIVGNGIIDGNSDAFFDFTKPHYSLDFDPGATRQGQGFMDAVLRTDDGPVAVSAGGRAGTMIIFSNCKNVIVRDVTLRNAPNWTVHFSHVEDGIVDGVRILNDVRIPNNDGVDCFGCKRVRFSNCDFRTGDDDIAIVGSEDVTVTNSSMLSNSSGIRLEDTRNSVFNNLTIHANRGIGIYERGKGRTSAILFSNIVIETHLLLGHWWGKGEPIYIAIGEAEGKLGQLSGVRFSNITAEAENGIMLYGAPGTFIRDISFEQVKLKLRVTRKEVNDAVGGNFDLRWTTDHLMTAVFSHDIPALYARYVDGLDLHGLSIEWVDRMPEYYSSALEIEDVNRLTVDRFRGRQASIGSHSPVIALNRVDGVSICNSSSAEGSEVFVSTNNISGESLFEGNDVSLAASAFNGVTNFIQFGNRLPDKKP